MTTIAQTVAGTVLKISAALPATYDAAGFAALSYTTVSETTDLGSVGKVYDLVDHRPTNDRKKYKFKGGYDNGSMQLKLARATLATGFTDAGQTILQAASNSDADYSFKMTFQDNSDFYFTAKVMEFQTEIGSLNNILGLSAKLELTSDIIETA